MTRLCFGSNGDLRVSEVWESREQQEQFAQARDYLLRASQAGGAARWREAGQGVESGVSRFEGLR